MSIKTIVVHDVLQNDYISGRQSVCLGNNTTEDAFFKSWGLLDSIKCKKELLILANGIDKFPNWVQHLKNMDNVEFCCHGLDHGNPTKISPKTLYNQLKVAKDLIERTFETEVKKYHPPANKYNDEVLEVVKSLGMETRFIQVPVGKVLKKPWAVTKVDFHYWYYKDINNLKEYTRGFFDNNNIYIIGAPRSGTTAYMNYLGSLRHDLFSFKEKERIWGWEDQKVQEYYSKHVKGNKKIGFIDKNCRNSLRLPRILGIYPDAQYVHLIRDGRAVANSWRNYATRTNKKDVSIENAASQWNMYITSILANRRNIKNYAEVRYEDLCDDGILQSRNGKWKEDLSGEEKETVTSIQLPLLKEFGYV